MYRLNVEEFLKRAREWNMYIEVVEHIVTTYQDSSFELDEGSYKCGGHIVRNLGGFSILESELIEVEEI